jgi:hypothetical protein
MNEHDGTHFPKDQQEHKDASVTHGESRRLSRLGRLLSRPRAAAAFALVALLALNATGAFGLNVLGLHSALTASSLPGNFQSAVDPVYQLTPTQTTCQQFSGGTAQDQGPLTYGAKGNKINNVAPGVFFYWTTVKSYQAGSNTFIVQQSAVNVSGGTFYNHFFAVANGSFVYNSDCTKAGGTGGSIGPTTAGTNRATSTVTFTASAVGLTFFIGIKYSPSSIVGSPTPASPTGKATYSFATSGAPPNQNLFGPASNITLQHS